MSAKSAQTTSKMGQNVFLAISFHYEDRLFTMEDGAKILELLGKSISTNNEDWSGKPGSYTVKVHNEHTLMERQIDQLLGVNQEATTPTSAGF